MSEPLSILSEPSPERGSGRRQFLKGLAAAGLLAVSGAGAYGRWVEPYMYEITETDVFIKDLPAGFEGFRITQLTDLHHGRLVSLAEVRRVVELANGTRPDTFALTGDYVTSGRSYVEPCAEALGELRAPYGVWAVLGNHDHYVGAELVERALARRGVEVLKNANTSLRRGADSLQLAGVDDWGWGQADWGGALGGVDLSRPSLLLSHEPAVFDFPETRGVSLVVSGHTHGGQICLPFAGSPAALMGEGFRHLSGLFERDGRQLYVSRGTGLVGLPMRIGAPPEIAVLRLRRK